MSGGSLDYVYRRMQDGELIAQEWALEAFAERLKVHMAAEPCVWQADKREHRPPTPDERGLAQQGSEAALHKLAELSHAIAVVKARAAELAHIAHAVEWCDSGDFSEWDVWQAASKLA